MDLNLLLDWFKHYNYVCIPIFAFIIDTIIGDPNSKFHPVALIGRVISFYEAVLHVLKGILGKDPYTFCTAHRNLCFSS